MTAKPVFMQSQGDGENANRGTSVITRTKPKTKKPDLYRVLLLNDDYTPMEFVIHILERFFQKDREAATRIMLHVHNHWRGRMWRLHLRSRRNQSLTGDGFRQAT